jgi:hypothetical protein
VHRPSLRQVSRYRWPLVITLAVSVTAAFSASPVVEVASNAAPAHASLSTPIAYDVIAPISNILDALTLLTPRQHEATFGLCAMVFALFAVSIARNRRHSNILTLARRSIAFVGGVVAVLGVMLVAPRPMASLHLDDPDLVAVDFHSHTSASHDGRPGFNSEMSREWHRSAGFGAAYVTDHRTLYGALEAVEQNPVTAGVGTVLLPGVELHDLGEHPVLIGIDPWRMKITSPDWQDAAVKADGGPVPPILVLTMPGSLVHVPQMEYKGEIRLAAIEGSDGSPRGMAQTAGDRAKIIELSNRLQLSLVSGSDNHGWGRAAAAWTVLRIPGWRAMDPAGLDIAIRRTVLNRAAGSIDVVERRRASAGTNKVEQALDGFAVVAMIFRTMNLRERFSWLVWSWGGAFGSIVASRRKRRRLRLVVRARRSQNAGRPLIDVAAAVKLASD